MTQKEMKGSLLLKQTCNVCPDWKSLLPLHCPLSGKETSEVFIRKSQKLKKIQTLSVHIYKVLLLYSTEEKNQIVVQRGTK